MIRSDAPVRDIESIQAENERLKRENERLRRGPRASDVEITVGRG